MRIEILAGRMSGQVIEAHKGETAYFTDAGDSWGLSEARPVGDHLATLLAAVGGRERFKASFAARTMRDLDRRVDSELADAEASIAEATAAIAKAAGDRPDLAEQLAGEWLERYVAKWAAYQHAGARTMNWMVTGPARFPTDRNRKRMDTEHKRLEELIAHYKGAGEWARKAINRQRAAELGPIGMAGVELEDARRNLAERGARQAMMKAANAAVRKARKLGNTEDARDQVAAELEAGGHANGATIARALYKAGLLLEGFASYQLSNNNAEIRRLEGRVKELERREAAAIAALEAPAEEPELEAGDAPRIVEDPVDQRVRIYFAGKPPAEIRDRLKGRGFRWSPTNGAWQRQLTNNAIDAARAIVDQ